MSKGEIATLVYVVAVEIPVDHFESARNASAEALRDCIITRTNLPTRAWMAIAETAEAVIKAAEPTR